MRLKQSGFSLIELIIALVIIAILSSIALPAYSKYINKSKANIAAADLIGLSLNLENQFQLALAYTAATTTTTTTTQALFPNGWNPTQAANFTYTATVTASSYTLTATGISTTGLNNCVLTLTSSNTRTATSSCGFTTW